MAHAAAPTATKVFIDGSGPPNTRYNIFELSTAKECEIQYSLYLRALLVIQAAQITDPLSYYRLAAIHGKPILDWPDSDDADHANWCSHGAPAFLPWHRVYLFLWEKTLVDEAVIIAREAPVEVRDQYVREARKIRQPFWDWAHQQDVPTALSAPSVTVIKIRATDSTNITNPLRSFTFPVPPPGSFPPTTTRYSDAVVKANLIRDDVRGAVYRALTVDQGYGAFSNTRFPNTAASIEQPHNSVHTGVGIFMAAPDVASFDPLFWFHHSAIDRYYALWQTIHPRLPWQENGTGSTIDQMLEPFQRSPPFGSWTNRMIQFVDDKHFPSFFEFGVQFTEVVAADPIFENQRNALNAIVALYGPVTRSKRGSELAKSVNPDNATAHYPYGCIPRSTWRQMDGTPDSLPDQAGIRREWKVALAVKDDIVVGNFSIFFFVGEPGPVSEWGTNNATVGAYHTFKGSLETCKNCQDHTGELLYGAIYLTEKLFDLVPPSNNFGNLSPVSHYLSKELSWRVRKADGTEHVFPAGDTSLTVSVESYIEAYAPVDDQGIPLPCDIEKIVGVTFNHETHPNITAGAPNYH